MEFDLSDISSNEFLHLHCELDFGDDIVKNNLQVFRNAILIAKEYKSYPLGGSYLQYERDRGHLKDSYFDEYSQYSSSYRYSYLQFRKKYDAKLNEVHSKWHSKKQKKEQTKVYMVTFTIDPKKVPEFTPEIKSDIETYIASLKTRDYIAEPEKYVSRYELPEGTSNHHWHVAMHTNRKIDKTRFQYYTTNYGNVDLKLSKTGEYKYTKLYVTKTDPGQEGKLERAILDKLII